MRSDDDPRLLAVLDMDTALFSEEGKPNTQLIEALKKNGIQDVCLLTEVSAEEMLDPDDAAQGKQYKAIKKLLEDNQFIVHAVVTPIDPVYKEGKTPGLAWKEQLELSSSRADISQFENTIQDKIITLDWDTHDVLRNLVNYAIAGNISIDLINTLQARVKKIRDEMNEIIRKYPTGYLGEKAEYYEQINNVLSYILSLLQNKNGVNAAITYILSLEQIENLSWLEILEDERDPLFSQKNSMYACMVPLVKQFNGVVFVDVNSENVDNMKKIHEKLTEDIPFYSIKEDPEFKDSKEYDKNFSWALKKEKLLEELNSLSNVSEDDMSLLKELKKKVSERLDILNKESDNFTSIGVAFRIFCIVLEVFIFQLKSIQKQITEKKSQFINKLGECIALAPENEKPAIYARYKDTPMPTRNLGLWSKVDVSIADETKIAKPTNQSPSTK